MASYSKGKGYSKDDLTESGTPVILYGRLYTKYESVIEEVDTFVDASNDGIYSHGDEVIVPASGETAEDIARASAVAQPGVLLGGDLNILRPNKSITSLFMALSLSNGTAQKELSKRAQGKSVVHVHNSDIQDVTISYPTIDEQTQIGAFFRSLDSLITLHQRKLDHLKEMKKGLLQKMFPKNGESIPELRFPGFADPWEQRKFSEIATLRRGLTYSPNDITDKNGGIRVLRSSNISGDQFELHDDDVFVREDAVKIAPAEDGDILITAANGSSNLVGKRARICNLPGKTVHGGFMLLASTGDSYYLNAAMGAQWYRRFLHMGVAGGNGALGNLDMKALLDYELLTPSRNERKKIGSLFNRLDSLITLHQRERNIAISASQVASHAQKLQLTRNNLFELSDLLLILVYELLHLGQVDFFLFFKSVDVTRNVQIVIVFLDLF